MAIVARPRMWFKKNQNETGGDYGLVVVINKGRIIGNVFERSTRGVMTPTRLETRHVVRACFGATQIFPPHHPEDEENRTVSIIIFRNENGVTKYC